MAWRDVTARMGSVFWPRSTARSFWKRSQLTGYLARTFPRNTPAAPQFDFERRRLVLVAAGPRSSTGYGVQIVRIVSDRSGVHVLARETTPSLERPTAPQLTSPYRLITIPATSKRVDVSWQGRP